MSQQWKSGDVALVEAGCWANRKVALRLADGWSHVNGVNLDGDGVVAPVRPLVVIDPESDDDLIDRFRDALRYEDAGWIPSPALIRTALRSLTEPPKPTEVYEHFPEPFAKLLHRNGVTRSLCGKVWKPGADNTVSVGKCPECVAIIEAGWVR